MEEKGSSGVTCGEDVEKKKEGKEGRGGVEKEEGVDGEEVGGEEGVEADEGKEKDFFLKLLIVWVFQYVDFSDGRFKNLL